MSKETEDQLRSEIIELKKGLAESKKQKMLLKELKNVLESLQSLQLMELLLRIFMGIFYFLIIVLKICLVIPPKRF